jgi:hypothetical protein
MQQTDRYHPTEAGRQRHRMEIAGGNACQDAGAI